MGGASSSTTILVILTFDTTYISNMYDMPFGLFVGVKNHFQSIILGGVLTVGGDDSKLQMGLSRVHQNDGWPSDDVGTPSAQCCVSRVFPHKGDSRVYIEPRLVMAMGLLQEAPRLPFWRM
jgi:hypothetical protein